MRHAIYILMIVLFVATMSLASSFRISFRPLYNLDLTKAEEHKAKGSSVDFSRNWPENSNNIWDSKIPWYAS